MVFLQNEQHSPTTEDTVSSEKCQETSAELLLSEDETELPSDEYTIGLAIMKTMKQPTVDMLDRTQHQIRKPREIGIPSHQRLKCCATFL